MMKWFRRRKSSTDLIADNARADLRSLMKNVYYLRRRGADVELTHTIFEGGGMLKSRMRLSLSDASGVSLRITHTRKL